MITKINQITAKTILTKTSLPGCDYVVNPYNGCQFACMYCYAAQIARWKHPKEEWGTYLDVKINAPKLLKKELEKVDGEKTLYCFTLDPMGLSKTEFVGWHGVTLEPIPQKILDVYKQIYEY